MTHILIIGFGNIGARHAQSLLEDKSLKISVVETNPNTFTNNLKIIKSNKSDFHDVSESLIALSRKNFDVIIVATSSKPRYSICIEIFKILRCEILILEKIVFQNLNHFNEILRTATDSNCRVYVNLPLRTRSKIPITNLHSCTIRGAELGLLCNSVHYIDYFINLMGLTGWSSSAKNLKFHNSRRGSDYVESYGKLKFQHLSGFILDIESFQGKRNDIEWTLDYGKNIIKGPQSNIIQLLKLESGFNFFQSQITLQILEDIYRNQISLPSLEIAKTSHSLLFCALEKYEQFSNGNFNVT